MSATTTTTDLAARARETAERLARIGCPQTAKLLRELADAVDAERARLDWVFIHTDAADEIPAAHKWEGGPDWYGFLRAEIDAAIAAEGEGR